MTLGEFRTYTESLSDDIELCFAYGEDTKDINTFTHYNNNKLILCSGIYIYNGDLFKTMLKAVAFLKKK